MQDIAALRPQQQQGEEGGEEGTGSMTRSEEVSQREEDCQYPRPQDDNDIAAANAADRATARARNDNEDAMKKMKKKKSSSAPPTYRRRSKTAAAAAATISSSASVSHDYDHDTTTPLVVAGATPQQDPSDDDDDDDSIKNNTEKSTTTTTIKAAITRDKPSPLLLEAIEPSQRASLARPNLSTTQQLAFAVALVENNCASDDDDKASSSSRSSSNDDKKKRPAMPRNAPSVLSLNPTEPPRASVPKALRQEGDGSTTTHSATKDTMEPSNTTSSPSVLLEEEQQQKQQQKQPPSVLQEKQHLTSRAIGAAAIAASSRVVPTRSSTTRNAASRKKTHVYKQQGGQTDALPSRIGAISVPGEQQQQLDDNNNSNDVERGMAASSVSQASSSPVLVQAQVVDPEKEAAELARRLGYDKPVVHAVDVQAEPSSYHHEHDHSTTTTSLRLPPSRWTKTKATCFTCFVLTIFLAVIIPVVVVLSDNKNGGNDNGNAVATEPTTPPVNSLQALTSTYQEAVNTTNMWVWLAEYADPQAFAAANGEYTVLAPRNDALQLLLNNKYWKPPFVAHLRNLLLQHLIPGRWTMERLMTLAGGGEDQVVVMRAMNGEYINVTAAFLDDNKNGTVSFRPSVTDQDISIIEGDLVDDDGNLVHVVDGLLKARFLTTSLTFAEFAADFDMVSTALAWFESSPFSLEFLLILDDWTVFCPSNEALESLPATWQDKLRADSDLLLQTLMGHGVPYVLPREMFAKNQSYATFDTTRQMQVHELDGEMFIFLGEQSARVIATDFLSADGIVHVVDKFLIPERIRQILDGEL